MVSQSPDLLVLHSGDRNSTLRISLENATPSLTLLRCETPILSASLLGLISPHSASSSLPPYISSSDNTYKIVFPATSSSARTLQEPHPISIPSSLSITSNPTSFDLTLSSPASSVELAVNLSKAAWFGLGHLMHQHWPLNTAALPLGPCYPFDNGPTGLCTLLESTFVSSAGALVAADDSSPCLHVSMNPPPPTKLLWGTGVANFDRKILPVPVSSISTDPSDDENACHVADDCLTLQSRRLWDHPFVDHPWSQYESESSKQSANPDCHPALSVSLAATSNVREATLTSLRQLREAYGPVPTPQQKLSMMRQPIWSTWAHYKDAVTQTDVLEFAERIASAQLGHSVMGIDDRWSIAYGELRFDEVKFPDPAAMTSRLHELGFLVTLWVTPFATFDSKHVVDPATSQYFVQLEDGQPGPFDWWQPTQAVALDVMNPKACAWFVSQLRRLCDEYGIDGFKFDAGEPCFLPKGSRLHNELVTPNDYTRAWIHNVASHFPVSEVRSGVRGCQSATSMFRIFDRFSTWGLQNGLASVLAAVLTSGVLGFPFCIPDYVAGNAYDGEVPDLELMVRWAQASVAMPAIQLSIPPWQFGSECEQLVARTLRWRNLLFWPAVKDCIEDAAQNLLPIARPMWWEEPELDGVAEIYDQFLVGKDIVVAPVVVCGQRERAVFLPRGVWRRVNMTTCEMSEERVVGPVWLERVDAQLDDMPVFRREHEYVE